MALRYKWLDKAQADFYATLEYVFNEFGENTAEKVYAEVTDMIKLLCVFPEAGTRYKDLVFQGNEVRIFQMKKSSVVYCHDDKTLYVIAFGNHRCADATIPDN